MGIKSNVTVTNSKPFPKLMIATKGEMEGTIAIFERIAHNGFVLSPKGKALMGGISQNPCHGWQDFEGEITLSNE